MTATIAIRNADKDDLDAVNHVITAAVMGWQLPERVIRLSLSSYVYNETDLQHLQLVIAAIDDNIVGVLSLDHDQPDNAMLIHGLFVNPDQQHRGVGTRLFERAILIAQQQQCSGLLVRSHKDATGFFTAMGMTRLDVNDQQRDYQERYWKQIG